MKTRVRIFLAALLVSLSIIPALNLKKMLDMPGQRPAGWWKRQSLYNLSDLQTWLQIRVMPHGISLSPGNAVFGPSGWLHLGDDHEDSITFHRAPATPADRQQAEQIAMADRAWREWLKRRGVRDFRILVAPDKASIYPEQTPAWSRPSDGSADAAATNVLFSSTDPSIRIDARGALRRARIRLGDTLYYRNDSHWTQLGAWYALEEMIGAITRTGGTRFAFPALESLTQQWSSDSPGGDLSTLLRIQDAVRDIELKFDVPGHPVGEIVQTNLVTGSNETFVDAPRGPVPRQETRLQSRNAMNPQRALWLHDSFGGAMVRFMTTMFGDVIHRHVIGLTTADLARMVEQFRPDFVLITVVERQARLPQFGLLPPPSQ